MKNLRLLITLILLTTAFNYVLAASSWEPPTSNPPGNNADAPLNVSNASQEKEGPLSINDALAVFGKTFFGDSITIQDGTHGSGKLLSSDAQGLAAWKTLSELGIGQGGSGTVTTVLGAFGDWEQKSKNTDYRAETDGIVVVRGTDGPFNLHCRYEGYTDSSPNPTTMRVNDGNYVGDSNNSFNPDTHGFSMPVRSGDYWRIGEVHRQYASECPNTLIWWLPIESAASGGSGGGGIKGYGIQRYGDNLSTAHLRVACPAGTTAIGGGGRTTGGAFDASSLKESYPSIESTNAASMGTPVADEATFAGSWSCRFTGNDLGINTCYAICADAN